MYKRQALFAARGNKRVVSMVEFEKAKDKIMMGAERRSMVMTEAQKEKVDVYKRQPARYCKEPS